MKKERKVDDLIFLANLMDSQIQIPQLSLSIGLDFIIGLLPIGGDVITTIIAIYSLIRYKMEGASGEVMLKMLGNVALDFVVGSIPILGDIFDLGYKANQRNLKLWFEFSNENKHQGSGSAIVLTSLLMLLILIGTGIFVTTVFIVKVIEWIKIN